MVKSFQNKYFYLIILLFIDLLIIAQENPNSKLLEKADKQYDNFEYIDANKIYLKVAESGYISKELFERIGNTFYFNANYKEASKWYTKLFDNYKKEGISYKFYLRYSQTLKSTGQLHKAKDMYDLFISKSGILNKSLENSNDYLKIIRKDSSDYQLETLDFNTTGVDFGIVNNGEKLYLSSTGDPKAKETIKNTWNNLPYLDIYELTKEPDGTYGTFFKVKGDINTKESNECCTVFTKSGNIMYFTRNNTATKNRKKHGEEITLKIYRAHLVDGKWTNIESLSINSDTYSVAHPALNHTEDKLYFSSDMPGSYGETDIYVVDIYKDGSLGTPINLGPKINTKGRESFPFLSKDDELYFSSDGHFGLGGLDVFYVKLKGEEMMSHLVNVGQPINSNLDDFAFTLMEPFIYVSSNRIGGKGFDDIYRIKKIKPIIYTDVALSGIILEKGTKIPVENAEITLYNEKDELVAKYFSDINGYFQVLVDPTKKYILKVYKENFDGDDLFIDNPINLKELNLSLIRSGIKVEEIKKESSRFDLTRLLNIVIYFNINSSEILPEAFVELEKLIAVMEEFPNLKVAINSHTDSQGEDAYNLWLSEKRAHKILHYLVKRGIDQARLTAKGFGETQLINNCSNGVDCLEIEHSLNRRIEFIISID